MEEENILNYFDHLLNEFTIKLATVGLDDNDYPELKKVIGQLAYYCSLAGYHLEEFIRLQSFFVYNHFIMYDIIKEESRKEYQKEKSFLQDYFFELTDIRNHFIALREALKEILPCTIERFLHKETCLMHLVYTINQENSLLPPKIKGRFKSTFLCHFHREKTPSMEIDSLAQYGFCYGCGESFDLFSYFMLVEKIDKEEAIDLLCRIYLIDKENNKVPESDDRIKKYQDALMSQEYRECLLTSLKKAESMPDRLYKTRCLNKINKALETIDRIKNKEVIYFSPTSGEKRLTLDWRGE